MRIFSGIQPTGRKHLGNYIGAITQYVAGQDRGEAIYCVVDLHAITVAYEPAALRESVYDTAATLLAAGLDPERCIFFRQSDVREHTELTWLLSSVTAFGELNRMTQFKEKSGAQRELVSAGLFIYPVLQAADVLAYRANEVPVGEDQRQHVELMRDVAERFNARFGETLVVPEVRIPAVGARIMDLQYPERKMSTTGGSRAGHGATCSTTPDTIAKKIRSAVTDSGSEVRRAPDKAGISNLIEILAAVRGSDARGRSSASSTAPATARSSGGRRRRGRLPGAGPRALRGAARRRGGARADPRRRAPRRPGRSPPTRSPTCARRWASDRSGSAELTSADRARSIDLELDLDVFAGPFDLLLTLILREEVDLLEVDLADVVITYIDHLERRGELDLEAATEFLVLIAALLELKSRLMLPGEELEELELDPGEAAEELLARLLDAHRYRAAAELPARAAARRGRATASARRRCRRRCAGPRCSDAARRL